MAVASSVVSPSWPSRTQQVDLIYSPLKGRQNIRLLLLNPATDADTTISGRLLVADLDQHAGAYEALSYVWGDRTNTVQISIDSQLFKVTINLHNALRRLRLPDEVRTLWVDAICINQNDVVERNAQVAIMADIYTSAKQVCVWLGEDAGKAHLVFEHIPNPVTRAGDFTWESDESAGPNYKGATLEAYHSLTRREWFSRTWVIQEATLCSSVLVMCGRYEKDWERLWNRGGIAMGGFTCHPLTHTTPNDRWYMLQEIREMPNHGRGRGRGRTSYKVGLDSVPKIFAYSNLCGATDPRDKVYGLLALFEGQPISIDYRKTIAEVYQEFTKAVIIASESLSILHLAGTKRLLPDLPSWVPDYSVETPTGVMPDANNPAISYLSNSNMGWHTCKPLLGDADEHLTLSGKVMDIVAASGPELVATNDNIAGSPEFAAIMCAWARLADEHAAGRSTLSIMQGFSAALRAERTWNAGGDNGHMRWRNEHHFLEWYMVYGGNAFSAEHVTTLKQHVESYETHLEFEPRECVEEFTRDMEPACYGRSMFATKDGTLGLAPPSARCGDSVVFLAGGLCPFILRRRQDATWTLVGDCYLCDLDPFGLWDDASKAVEWFKLR